MLSVRVFAYTYFEGQTKHPIAAPWPGIWSADQRPPQPTRGPRRSAAPAAGDEHAEDEPDGPGDELRRVAAQQHREHGRAEIERVVPAGPGLAERGLLDVAGRRSRAGALRGQSRGGRVSSGRCLGPDRRLRRDRTGSVGLLAVRSGLRRL